jgi:hypothetical protein
MSDLTRPTGGDGFSVAGPSPIPSVAKGAPVEANNGATHRLRVGPSRSMRVIAGEVEALLDGVEESSRHSAAILATELVAQVVGRAPDFDGEPVALIVQRGEAAVRLAATGPVTPSAQPPAGREAIPTDPLADWGRFIIDRLADHGQGADPLSHVSAARPGGRRLGRGLHGERADAVRGRQVV